MKLSVIVCTRNRIHALISCLNSIAQSLACAAPVDAEIVVVDNGSTDNTYELVKDWASTCAYPVNLQSEPRTGLCRARNRGIRVAQGDILAWTDDDCRVSKDYVRDILRYDTEDTELVLRGGRVELGNPSDLPLTIKTTPTGKQWRKGMLADHETPGNSILGCNMVMRRALVDRIGLFDEKFGVGSAIPSADDADYFFRAYIAGIPIEYVPDMTVYHHHGRNHPADGVRLIRIRAQGEGALYIKYLFKTPKLCRQFYWNVKNAMKEIMCGKWAEETGFSYKIMVAYGVLGAIKYLGISVKQLHENIICSSSALLASALRWCANIYRPALSRPD